MDKEIEEKLTSILEAISSLDARITKIETNAEIDDKRAGQTKPKKKTAIKEFLLENPPPDDIRRTLAIGYFLENNEEMSSFTNADLLQGYGDAKESPPSNISVNISRCIKEGHMMEASEKKNSKKAYVVTRSGERFVEGRYPKAVGK